MHIARKWLLKLLPILSALWAEKWYDANIWRTASKLPHCRIRRTTQLLSTLCICIPICRQTSHSFFVLSLHDCYNIFFSGDVWNHSFHFCWMPLLIGFQQHGKLACVTQHQAYSPVRSPSGDCPKGRPSRGTLNSTTAHPLHNQPHRFQEELHPYTHMYIHVYSHMYCSSTTAHRRLYVSMRAHLPWYPLLLSTGCKLWLWFRASDAQSARMRHIHFLKVHLAWKWGTKSCPCLCPCPCRCPCPSSVWLCPCRLSCRLSFQMPMPLPMPAVFSNVRLFSHFAAFQADAWSWRLCRVIQNRRVHLIKWRPTHLACVV